MTRTTSLLAAGPLAGDRRGVEAALERCAERLLVDAPPTIAAPIRYALDGGGKRMRPVLCVAAYRAVSGRAPDEAIFDVAVA
ncbi:MAG: hypothetical protein ACRELX_02280, partial [Longimicrobiales bacterium]